MNAAELIARPVPRRRQWWYVIALVMTLTGVGISVVPSASASPHPAAQPRPPVTQPPNTAQDRSSNVGGLLVLALAVLGPATGLSVSLFRARRHRRHIDAGHAPAVSGDAVTGETRPTDG